MAYPRYILSRNLKKARRSSSNLTLNSTAWADVETTLDMTFYEVQVGDELVYGISGLVGAEATVLALDVVTLVAGTPLNSFSARGPVLAPFTGSEGVLAWRGATGVLTKVSGDAPPYTVVAGDLTANSVTLRLRYATSTATAKTLYANTIQPFDVWAINLGPVQ